MSQTNNVPPIDGPREDPRVTSMLDLGAPVESFFRPSQPLADGLPLMLRTFQGMVRRFQSWKARLAIMEARISALEVQIDLLTPDAPV